LKQLLGPFELLELGDGQSIDLRIQSFERGTMVIHPRNLPTGESKTIEALRLHLQAGVKPVPPNYYDVTSQTLIAQFLPNLYLPGFEKYSFRVTKYGIAPRARFTLQKQPIQAQAL
jgi:hypothetical protein